MKTIRDQIRQLEAALASAAHDALILQRRLCQALAQRNQAREDLEQYMLVHPAEDPKKKENDTLGRSVKDATVADLATDPSSLLALETALHKERVLNRGLKEQVALLQASEVEAAAVEQQLVAARARITKLEGAVKLEEELRKLNDEAERDKGLPADIAILKREKFHLEKQLEALAKDLELVQEELVKAQQAARASERENTVLKKMHEEELDDLGRQAAALPGGCDSRRAFRCITLATAGQG